MTSTNNYLNLFLNDTPLLDVRAPVEFHKGHFPHSTNIPLLDDEQRHLVGTEYKEKGQDAAITLGWSLASDAIKQQRQQHWLEWMRTNPSGLLYCFRGGLRSRLSQQLIDGVGANIRFIDGGYKAMRRFLIDDLDKHCHDDPIVLVSGRTGSGKTRLLTQLPHFVDLEGLANHRGSAFGQTISPQPSQVLFESSVMIGFLKHRHNHFSKDTIESKRDNQKPLFIEDEGRLVGQVSLPLVLQDKMKTSPLILLQTDVNTRIDYALEDYVTDRLPEYIERYGDRGIDEFDHYLQGNLSRIKKRLGAEQYDRVSSLFSSSLQNLVKHDDCEGFREAIKILLTQYYDSMYDYQLSRREGKILAEGNHQELLQWSQHYSDQYGQKKNIENTIERVN